MKMFFQMLVVLFLGLMTAGCMTEYSHFEGPRYLGQNYPAGSSNWRPLPPVTTTTYYAGSYTGGRIIRYDDGPRHGHHHHHHDDYHRRDHHR